MKMLCFIAVFFFLSSCLSYKELPVEYDYSFNGRFNKYRTYNFFDFNSFHGEDTLEIRGAIEKHMKFLGYKRKKKKPDLLLNYAIYEDSLKFRGYIQPEIVEWAERPNDNLDYHHVDFDLTNGTLLIQIYDRRMHSSIWQGYATDRYRQINFYNYKEVNNAVRSILNSYQFFAKDFIDEQLNKPNTQ